MTTPRKKPAQRRRPAAAPAIDTRETPVPLFGEGGWIEKDPEHMLTEQSARYVQRQNKARLAAEGATLIIGGRIYVRPTIWRRVVIALGEEAARAKVIDDKQRALAVRKQSLQALQRIVAEEEAEIHAIESGTPLPETAKAA